VVHLFLGEEVMSPVVADFLSADTSGVLLICTRHLQSVVQGGTAVNAHGRCVSKCCRLLSNLPAGQEADAYDVLGVEPSATSGEIKKRYWRLSLLIHPDKCAHPRANDAFQAVSKVSKELQVCPSSTQAPCSCV